MSHLGLLESLAGEGYWGQMHKLFRLQRRPKPGKVQTPTLPQQSKPQGAHLPYLALFEAVFLLSGRDDLEGDGSLGLGLKGEGTEVDGFLDPMLSRSSGPTS